MKSRVYDVPVVQRLIGWKWLFLRYSATVAGLPASIHANAVCAGLCAGIWHWGN